MPLKLILTGTSLPIKPPLWVLGSARQGLPYISKTGDQGALLKRGTVQSFGSARGQVTRTLTGLSEGAALRRTLQDRAQVLLLHPVQWLLPSGGHVSVHPFPLTPLLSADMAKPPRNRLSALRLGKVQSSPAGADQTQRPLLQTLGLSVTDV